MRCITEDIRRNALRLLAPYGLRVTRVERPCSELVGRINRRAMRRMRCITRDIRRNALRLLAPYGLRVTRWIAPLLLNRDDDVSYSSKLSNHWREAARPKDGASSRNETATRQANCVAVWLANFLTGSMKHAVPCACRNSHDAYQRNPATKFETVSFQLVILFYGKSIFILAEEQDRRIKISLATFSCPFDVEGCAGRHRSYFEITVFERCWNGEDVKTTAPRFKRKDREIFINLHA
jgi:hypothetical protein